MHCVERFSQLEQTLRVATSDGVGFAALVELFAGIFADRFEHLVAVGPVLEEAVVDE